MEEIPLDKEIERFGIHLWNNPRVIFSARFGDGKSYFLRRFKLMREGCMRMITLYPLNYSASHNEDIFEYIKRDILLQLVDDGVVDCIDVNALGKSLFSKENVLEAVGFLTSAIPGGELLNKLIRKASEIKASYDEHRHATIDEFLDSFHNKQGCIYERDAYTVLIEQTVKRIKESGKRVVLLIEDLDRMDPHHVFRILNILGAHIDEDEDSNKFGFDNIVVVLDYDKTEHIFHHFYGKEANYAGYMSKFVSHYPFRYSITQLAQDYLYRVIEEKCGLNHNAIAEFEIKGIPDHEALGSLIAQKSVRDIVKVIKDLDSQYDTRLYYIRNNCMIKSDAPFVIFLSILKRLECDISDYMLTRSIRKLPGTDGFNMLGAFMLKEAELSSGYCFKNNNKMFIADISTENSLTCCTFHECRGGAMLQADLNQMIGKAINEARKFVHDI